ncbi:carboxypeptidase-like regulatory domain-containing protein [Dactylosporangium darangshiense]|uniref:Alpha-amylase n=1 Tax=Dactylosporangium darangshiense TaxID=579108 RepID=A0ABP8D4H9_9ACTN
MIDAVDPQTTQRERILRKHALRRPLLYAALTATVAAIAAVPAGSAAAATGGTITGHLTDAAGNPAANAFVTARAADWSTTSSAMSDASGAYTIAGLPANDYTVSFQPQGEIFTQYLHQKFVPADATHFAVAEGATVVADDQVVRTGAIAGTLLGRDGAPVPARLSVFTAEGYNWVGGKDVAADGSFSVALPPSAYKLEFTIRGTRVQYTCVWIAAQPPWSSGDGCPAVTGADGTYSLAGLGPYAWPVQFVQRNYQWRWSGNAVNRHEATAVTVRPGRSVAANIKLRSTAGGTLTGAVRDAAGNPLDASVYAFDAVSGEAVQFGSGTPDGTPYTIALIAPQPVKLWYVLADGRRGWAGGADLASATTYQVRNNKTLTVNITVT